MTTEIDKRISARPKMVIEPGTLVKIQRGDDDSGGAKGIMGWYEQKYPVYDICARIFESQELYGMYLGGWVRLDESRSATWHEVMTEGRVYIFSSDQIARPNTPTSSSL